MVMRDIRKGKDILAWQRNTLIYFSPFDLGIEIKAHLVDFPLTP